MQKIHIVQVDMFKPSNNGVLDVERGTLKCAFYANYIALLRLWACKTELTGKLICSVFFACQIEEWTY